MLAPTHFQEISQVLLQLDTAQLNQLRQEIELLQKINEPIPSEIQEEYNILMQKRQAGNLTETEHERLIELADELEKIRNQQLRYLIQYAQLKNKSLDEVLEELNIKSNTYVA